MALPKIFSDIKERYKITEQSNLASNDSLYQGKCLEGIELCNKAISLINELSLFSNNEDFDEVCTNDIKYMQVPALLAYFTLKQTASEAEKRKKLLECGREYLNDFLRFCSLYGVHSGGCPSGDENSESSTRIDWTAAARNRNKKIELYKAEKERQRYLASIRPLLDSADTNESVKRDFYLTELKSWIHFAVNELHCIQNEIELVNQIIEKQRNSKSSQTETAPKAHKPESVPSGRPFIIISERMRRQNSVFGAGYPSLPLYTPQEWFDQQVRLGRMPNPASARTNAFEKPPSDAEFAEQKREKSDKAEDTFDDAAVEKARNFDDFKDVNPRGWGNTQNKG